MKRLLHISPDLALPQSAVTSTIVIYGGKGQGKTNCGAVIIEELAAAGLRWALLDPVGVSYGLRHSADGEGSGVECLILGGAHGDIPIEPTGGAVVADLVADENVSVIIDISRKPTGEMWSIGERIRFTNDYGKQLFRRQGALLDGQRREPICQIIDEAARFIPQMIRSGQPELAQCASTWATIVEEGRNIGLGVVLLTQRSARLSKDVAELADLMLAFRTVGPNSIEAVIDWLGAHIPKTQAHAMIEQVRSLPVGSCLAVSPGWLQIEKVIRIRPRHTFDSSATPKPGEKAARVRGAGAKPDLAIYAARMKETIQRAAADDPKALKRRIAELEAAAKIPQKSDIRLERPSITPERERMLLDQIAGLQSQTSLLKQTAGAYEKALTNIGKTADMLAGVAQKIKEEVAAVQGSVQAVQAKPVATPAPIRITPAPVARPAPREAVTVPSDGSVPRAQMRILNALAWFKTIGIDSPATTAAAFIAGYTVNGHFNNLRGALRSAGLVEYTPGGGTILTPDGARLATAPDIPATNEGIQGAVLTKLNNAEGKLLRPLLATYPESMANEDLAQQSGYTVNGHFNNLRGKLRGLGLITYEAGGSSKAAEFLFPLGV